MKRKLISFEAFKKIEEGSLTKAEQELVNAEDILSKALGVDVELHCFSENDVTYSTEDGTFIHAVYKIENDQVILENVQELVIDTETAEAASRKTISDMVDALLENKNEIADDKFAEYFQSPNVRMELQEALTYQVKASKPTKKRSKLYKRKQKKSDVMKRIRSKMKHFRTLTPSKKKAMARERAKTRKLLGKTSNPRARLYGRFKKTMKEWATLSENVLGYIDFKTYGPLLTESVVNNDNNGNVIGIAVPNTAKRNEGKILSMNYKTIDTELKVLRSKAKSLNEDQAFVKAVAEIKRYNNISDNSKLEEGLENIVAKWPSVLYLTQDELSANIAEAFEIANISNYDDNVCNFIAEAILRTAHHAYTDRVKKIAHATGITNDITSECKTCKDSYIEFQKVANKFYSKLDESDSIDMRVFSDLYRALHEMHKAAIQVGDEVTKVETASFMSECEAVLNKASAPTLELAEDISNYINDLVEANLDHSGEWSDSGVHTSVGGEHPLNAWAAKQTDAVPSKYNGRDEYGVDHSPVSDGKDLGGEEEMMGHALGNDGGDDTWPTLKNPYIPEPMEFTLKGEKGADKDSDDLGTYQDGDTYPNLHNTLAPESKKPEIKQ